MQNQSVHSFHIPVLGLAFSVDTPLRVARYGIASVISIVDDILIERMREHYSNLHGKPYTAIDQKQEDHRARRITAYLNLVNQIVREQMTKLKASPFEKGSEIVKYFEMLAEHSPLKAMYRRWAATRDAFLRANLENELRSRIRFRTPRTLSPLSGASCGANSIHPSYFPRGLIRACSTTWSVARSFFRVRTVHRRREWY